MNPSNEKRLYRSRERVFGGVLGGLAKYMNVDPSIVRIVYVLAFFITGAGALLLAYIVGWIVVPEEPKAIAEGSADRE